MRPFADDFAGAVLGALIVASLLILALILTPIALIGIPAYIFIRLYRESPKRLERLAKEETDTLYQHALTGNVELSETEIEERLARQFPKDTPSALKIQLFALGKELFRQEGLSPDIPPPPVLCNTVEGARYRDQIARLGQARHDKQMMFSALETIGESLAVVADAVPAIEGDILIEVRQFMEPLGASVEAIIAPFFEPSDYHHFKALKDQLNRNLERTHRTEPIFPSQYKQPDLIETYLGGTLLKDLFALRTPFAIPEASRFEHTHIVAGSGHGKTQTLQYFIAKDLKEVAARDKSVVVIDSQGDLINTILAAKTVPPEQIVLIDPEDISFPVCLNLFSVGQERLSSYGELERERLTNSIIELYDFVLGSLLSAGMTAKQSVVFRYVTRLMFHIPNATIHTLVELLEPGGTAKYQSSIAALSGTPRRFFETEFDSKEFASTKTQVLRRLYGVLENQTFERMFTNPQSKFDMFSELNAGKLILINTSKSLLKEQGTEIFGRFFISLIAQAAQERATLEEEDRLPALIYVDEAHEYFDQNIGIILSQARKYKVGMVLAHQFLGQLTSGLQEAFEANTSIKMAGGVSARDARSLAGSMAADPEVIMHAEKGSFATYIRGFTKRAVPMSIPFFVLEKRPKASKEEIKAIREHSRKTYAEPLQNKAGHGEPSSHQDSEEPGENRSNDPTEPSSEL